MSRNVKLSLSILLCLGAGAIGSLFTSPAITGWYATLTRPRFAPPNWLFGPVWTVLFIMMGTAFFLVWEKIGKTAEAKPAAVLFLFHLALNVLWSVLFFGLKQLDVAFMEIMFLWGMIALLLTSFYRVDRRASYLLIPYFLWVTFASVLNQAFWLLNTF